MFEIPIDQLIGLVKAEPGSGMVQSILLFLIWINARGLKKELRSLKNAITGLEVGHGIRLGTLEEKVNTIDERLILVEKH
jgi:hypothetical protein